MATTFPESIQNFETVENITAEDGSKIDQFHQYMEEGNYVYAQVILESIPNYRNKIVESTRLNTIQDTVVALEKYYASRFSPNYVVSLTQPTGQEKDDLWFEIWSNAT